MSPASISTAVYDLADQYVARYAALDPVDATRMGVPGHDDALTDFSPDGQARRVRLARDTLTDLHNATVTSDRDRVARDALMERLRSSIELDAAGQQYHSLSILVGDAGSLMPNPMQALCRVFDIMPRTTEDQWRNIAARMLALPSALSNLRRTLDIGIERGDTVARRQAVGCARQAADWSGPQSQFTQIIKDFEATVGTNGSIASELRHGATEANDALANFGLYLERTYAPAAEHRDAVGRDRYAIAVRDFVAGDLDLDETYAYGWAELRRVEAEMADCAERIAPGLGLESVKNLLNTDPGRAIDGVDAFRDWMQQHQDETIAALNGTHFDIPEPIQRIEARIAPPGGSAAMYYTPPSEDFARPGRTWYPTGGRTQFPLWGEVTTAHHEGVPGHHLHMGTLVYQQGHLSRWQRVMAAYPTCSEGWGLYAERLMADLGYLDNPDYYLGMLRDQALRCARVVVDIGMHLELPIPGDDPFHPGETWTPELGMQFMLQRSHYPATFLASEIDRYLGMPAQAITYKIGERVWLDAREAARRRDGASFDLRAFHARALNLGLMGLDQMGRELVRST